MKHIVSLVCLALVIDVQRSAGVNIKNFFEQRCSRADGGFVTKNFENWSANHTGDLFFPLISKVDLLRLTEDLFQRVDLGFLSGQDVLNSCITVRGSQSPVFRLTFSGYCGRTFSKVLKPEEPKVFSWVKLFPDGLDGSFRISLSDNKSWQLVDVCWGDGQRSWAVISALPRLTPCTQRVIFEHLKAIGFSEKYFTGLQYDYCEANCIQNFRRVRSQSLPAVGSRN